MSNSRIVGLLALVAVFTLCNAGALAQPGGKPPFSGPPAAEELQVLAPFVGEWTTQATNRPNIRHKETVTGKGEMTCQWMHNRHFLRIEGFGVSSLGRMEHSTIIRFNRMTKEFEVMGFSSEGIVSQGVGEWDDKTQTFTTKGANLPNGWTAVGKMAIENGRFVQSLLVKNDKDEVVRDVTATAERRK